MFTMLMFCVNVCLSSTTMDPNMCGLGRCCLGYILEGDRCIVCPSGRYGKNCSTVCRDGFFGQKCQNKCPSDCNNTCNKVSGSCSGQSQELVYAALIINLTEIDVQYVQLEDMAKIAANSVLMDFTDKSVRTIAHQIVPTPAIKSLVLVQAMVKATIRQVTLKSNHQIRTHNS